MARFFGKVGYGIPQETAVDVWEDEIIERDYYGDVLTATRNLISSDKVNDDIRLQDRVSIVADAFASGNYLQIKYVRKAGERWTVTAVTVERPRLILSLGGPYEGPEPA